MKKFIDLKEQFYKKTFADNKMMVAYNNKATIITDNFEYEKIKDVTHDKYSTDLVCYTPITCMINKDKFVSALEFLSNIVRKYRNTDDKIFSNIYFLTDRDGLTILCFTEDKIYHYYFRCKIYNNKSYCISFKDSRLLIKYINKYLKSCKTLNLWCSSEYVSISNNNFGKCLQDADIMFHFKKNSYSYIIDNNLKYFKRYNNIEFYTNRYNLINILESFNCKPSVLFVNPYSKKIVFYKINASLELLGYSDIKIFRRLPIDNNYKILYVYNLSYLLESLYTFENKDIMISYNFNSSFTPINLIDNHICSIMPMKLGLDQLDKFSSKFFSRYYKTG